MCCNHSPPHSVTHLFCFELRKHSGRISALLIRILHGFLNHFCPNLFELVAACQPASFHSNAWNLSMALQPLWTVTVFFNFLFYTQSVGLLRRRTSPSQGLYPHTEQHEHRINAHRHLCLEWDSNPRPQCSSGRTRFRA
jgi:hypothetical protein